MSNSVSNPPRHPGFTLVELLVVIGIIALLISILLPVLNKAREQAKALVCQSNEKQVLLAFTMYVSAHKGGTPAFADVAIGYPPPANTPFHRSLGYYMLTAGTPGVIRYDKGSFWPYMTSGLHYTQTTGNTSPPPPDVLYRVFNCPSDIDTRGTERGGQLNVSVPRNFSYSWNCQFYANPRPPLGTWDGKTPPPEGWPSDIKNVSRISQIAEPAHKIILDEEMHPNDGWCFMGVEPNGNQDDLPSWRHNGRGNYGFADGHVESLSPSDIGYTTPFHFNDIPTKATGADPTWGYYFHLQSNSYR